MEAEIKAREEEINIRNLAINKQDKDHYISNEEPGPDMPARTARAKDCAVYIARKTRLRQNQNQTQELSISDQT